MMADDDKICHVSIPIDQRLKDNLVESFESTAGIANPSLRETFSLDILGTPVASFRERALQFRPLFDAPSSPHRLLSRQQQKSRLSTFLIGLFEVQIPVLSADSCVAGFLLFIRSRS